MTDLKPATLDDLFITRGEDGKLEPVLVDSALLNATISVIPSTYGYIKRNNLNMLISAVDWNDEQKLKYAQDHIVSPDISGLTIQDIEDRMGPLTLDHLVSLVVAQSVPMNRLRLDANQLAEAVKSVLAKNDSTTPSTSSISSDIPT